MATIVSSQIYTKLHNYVRCEGIASNITRARLTIADIAGYVDAAVIDGVATFDVFGLLKDYKVGAQLNVGLITKSVQVRNYTYGSIIADGSITIVGTIPPDAVYIPQNYWGASSRADLDTFYYVLPPRVAFGDIACSIVPRRGTMAILGCALVYSEGEVSIKYNQPIPLNAGAVGSGWGLRLRLNAPVIPISYPPLDDCSRWVALKWIDIFGSECKFNFRVLAGGIETSDDTDIIIRDEPFGGRTMTSRDYITAYLDDLDEYDYWLYSGILRSDEVYCDLGSGFVRCIVEGEGNDALDYAPSTTTRQLKIKIYTITL